MNKALYIIGIVLSIAFLITVAYNIEKVANARWVDYDIIAELTGHYVSPDMLTQKAALIDVVFLMLLAVIQLSGLLNVKRMTMRVISVIGLD